MALNDNGQRREWHLEKRVPVTIIMTLVVYFGTAMWWARGVEGEQMGLDRRVAALEAARDETALDRTKIAVLESNLEALKEQVSESRKVLDEIRSLLIQQRNGEAHKGR
jgi:hypothetical protein